MVDLILIDLTLIDLKCEKASFLFLKDNLETS